MPSPWRLQMPMAALESVHTRKLASTPKFCRSTWYPRTLPGAADNSCNLGLSRAQGHRGLCRRPVLDSMVPQHYTSSRRTLASAGTARPVGVRVNVYSLNRLLGVPIHEARSTAKRATNSPQRRPGLFWRLDIQRHTSLHANCASHLSAAR